MGLEPYLGACRVIDARDAGPVVTRRLIEQRLGRDPPCRVLLRTFDVFPRDRWRPDFTAVSAEAIGWLASRGIVLIGVDAPSLDPETSKTMDAHHAVLAHDMRILEGLVLDDVPPGDYELIALPLRLEGLDSSPVRAVLRALAMNVYFLGIAGAGMSALASILKSEGHSVSGSDDGVFPPVTTYLDRLAIPYHVGFDAALVPPDLDAAIIGSSAKLDLGDNPELAEFGRRGVPCSSFPEFLGRHTAGRDTVVVAGRFGKSSVTALLAVILTEAGGDPGYFIGAVPLDLPLTGSGGTDAIFVMEGDEYIVGAGRPPLEVRCSMTRVGADHLAGPRPRQRLPDPGRLRGAVRRPDRRPCRADALLVCAHPFEAPASPDRRPPRRLVRPRAVPRLLRGRRWRSARSPASIWSRPPARAIPLETELLGLHNIENIVGAAALLLERGDVTHEALRRGVRRFRGVARRLDKKTTSSRVPAYEGFGSSYEKARSAIEAMLLHFPTGRCVVVFEPHTFSWRDPAALAWYDTVFAGGRPRASPAAADPWRRRGPLDPGPDRRPHRRRRRPGDHGRRRRRRHRRPGDHPGRRRGDPAAVLRPAGRPPRNPATLAGTKVPGRRKRMTSFNGLGLHLGNLSRLSSREDPLDLARRTSPAERARAACRPTARPRNGRAGLGQGWKVSPFVIIAAGEERVLADIEGPGAIQQIWMTLARGRWRHTILRIYWDDQEQPSVECPVGDFFACGWEKFAQVTSLAVCVNPGRAFNCYWEMPFRKRARVTLTNLADEPIYCLLPDQLHADRSPGGRRLLPRPVPADQSRCPTRTVYTILDGVTGQGHYVGTYMAWGVNNTGWWGEGEIKFFMDGDDEFPTICGTGTEDYFCGAYNFDPGVVERDRKSEYLRVHHPLRRPAAGDPARRGLPLAAALRPLPLAHHGPGPLRDRPAGHHPGAGLAHRQGPPLPAAAGRHRLGRLLVPDPAHRAVPRPAGPGLSGSDLTPRGYSARPRPSMRARSSGANGPAASASRAWASSARFLTPRITLSTPSISSA